MKLIRTNVYRPDTCIANQSGVSLVELMIAMVISLILLGGVIQIVSNNKNSYNLQEGTSRLQQNARFAMDRIVQDLGAAGYMGCLDSADADFPMFNDLTNQAYGSAYDFGNAVFGTNGTGPNSSDTVSIRRGSANGGIRLTAPMADPTSPLQLDSADGAYAALEQYDILVVGDCGNASVFMITNDPTTSGGTIQHASGVTAASGPNAGQSNASGGIGYVYGAQTSSAGMAFQVGTLTYMLCPSIADNTRTSLFVNACGTAANEIVEGVQDMQITYGLDTDTTRGADQYLDASAITTPAQWGNVVSARITMTFDTVNPVPGGALTKNFTTTIRLRNRGES
jgi:type IV pilus assembly protein PilW